MPPKKEETYQVYVQGDVRAVWCMRQSVVNGWIIKFGLAGEAAILVFQAQIYE